MPRPRRVRAHQPRHAAPLAAPGARALGALPAPAALRRRRRVPPLPRGLRRPRRARCCAGCGGCARAYGADPDVRARLRHRRRAGRGRRASGSRAAGRCRHRRRLTARRRLAGAVGAAAHLVRRRARCPGAPRRAASRSPTCSTDLVVDGVRTLAFVRSRRGVETVALTAAAAAGRGRPRRCRDQVAAYRGGYLPEERREIEAALRSGELCGLAAHQRPRARHRRRRAWTPS